ncbi:kinase-like domain-containing protein [Armillaria luteobubalina]|uniref:Kinase-like domain-containing protein n=1 Tax=Armillaria luteobubalina TaxID=153913 RepID=A0AA39QIN6_9AGAR|nr:kinase-like domain-containing protein [Armillaria luteobubalina]
MRKIGGTPDESLAVKDIPPRKRLLDADPIAVITPSAKKRRKLHSSADASVLPGTNNLATALVPGSVTPLSSALPLTSLLRITQPQLPDARSKYTIPNSPSPSRSPSPEGMTTSFLRNAVRVPGKRRYRRRSSPSYFPPAIAVPERTGASFVSDMTEPWHLQDLSQLARKRIAVVEEDKRPPPLVPVPDALTGSPEPNQDRDPLCEDDEEYTLCRDDTYPLGPPYSGNHYYGHSLGVGSSAEQRTTQQTSDHEESFASGTQSTRFGKHSILPSTASTSHPKVSFVSGKSKRDANVSAHSSDVDEGRKDEAIVDALLDVSRQEPGPWHVLDVTIDKLAQQVVCALSKFGDKVRSITAKQAQSTLDFLQDLLNIQALPLSYKHTFLKTSLKLSRMYDCVPRCIMLRGFKKSGDYPFALGQFGEVWRGEVEGTEVAVKQARIFTNDNDIKEVLRKIRREAIIWGQCDHPNVLPFYGIYRDSASSSYCLVSAFMINGSLRQYLGNTAKPDRHRLGLDITRGMDYLHKMSIVHGDLKGDNILISDDHRAVIADFGISFVMGATTFGTSSSSRKGGTVRWQAPEVLNSSPNSFSADVYSLACVYFEVFDGAMPWSNLTDGAVIMKVYFQKLHLPRPKFLSENDLWWELMVQCWAYEPSVRPTLQYLMESLHATDDTLTSLMKWDRSILTRLRDPLVQGKLVVPSGLPSFLIVEGVSHMPDLDPTSVAGLAQAVAHRGSLEPRRVE